MPSVGSTARSDVSRSVNYRGEQNPSKGPRPALAKGLYKGRAGTRHLHTPVTAL